MTDVGAPQSRQHAESDEAQRAKARLRGFRLHLAVFAVVMIVVIAIGLAVDPGAAWMVLPPVAWGSVLAMHAAWAMGLFDVFRGERR